MIENFSKIGGIVAIKNVNAITKTNVPEDILNSAKRKPKSHATDDVGEFVNKMFTVLLNINSVKIFLKKMSFGTAFAKRFNRSIKDFLKRPVF